MSDYTNNNSVATTARVTADRVLASIPILWQWAAKGKVFEAGLGLEDTAIAAAASVADVTPTYSLQAPSSTSLLVIPIMLRVALTNDGSALSQLGISFTKPAGLCATSFTLTSGTALTSKHAVYKKNPALTAQQATALSAPTASALVAADYVEYLRKIAMDAALTTGVPNMGGPSNVAEVPLLTQTEIHIMTSGAALLVYVTNSTTDALSKPYFMWAEVSEDDLI